MAESIDDSDRELLEHPNFCMVATVREDGTPHVTPTWVDLDGDLVLLNTAEGRAWPRNLRRDPRVTLTIPDRENPYDYVTIRGRVAEDTHEGAEEHIDQLAMKYLGKETYPFRQPGEERVIFKIAPERVRRMGG